jgi:8-oxo-dGTP pyrophosphatase MutT (NUDIX family)
MMISRWGQLATRMWRRLWAGLASLLGRRPAHLQVAALCVRGKIGRREVLLVSSLRQGRWIIPKGWPMPGRSLAQAALQEAWEEAGVRGTVGAEPLGAYSYVKQGRAGAPRRCTVQVFVVKVSGMEDAYPEAGRRLRQWVRPAEAAEMASDPELKALFKSI